MAIKMEWSDDAGWIPVDTTTGMGANIFEIPKKKPKKKKSD